MDHERHFLGGGVSWGRRPRGPGGLPLGPCLDSVRERRDDGAGGASWRSLGFRSCRLGRSPMPAALSPARVWKTRYRDVEKLLQPSCPGATWPFQPVASP